jgi:protein O-mannosyl-transferase
MRQRSRATLLFAGILLAVALTYANSLRNSFHFDDFHTIVDNPFLNSPRNIPRFFSDATTFSVLPPNRTWRPILSTTLALDVAASQHFTHTPLNAALFHLDSLFLFALTLAAFFALALALFPNQPSWPLLATFAAALYALHPALAETVNYIIQRGDILVSLGTLTALTLYVRSPLARRRHLYLLPFALAMLSKPTASIFPLLLLTWLLLFDPQPPRRLLTAITPSLIAAALLLWLQHRMTPPTFAPTGLSASSYRIAQPYVLLRQFTTFVLPLHLNVDSDLQPFPALSPHALLGDAFLLTLLLTIFFTSRRDSLKPIAFGLAFFLFTNLPTSVFPLAELENDHRLFLPFAGLALAAAWTLHLAIRTLSLETHPILLTTAAGALLFASALGTHTRNRVWATEETLWLDDTLKSPHNSRGLMNYGLTQMELGRYDTALDYFLRALPLAPNYATLEINIAIDYGQLNNETLALQHFHRAIALAPESDQPWFYLGRYFVTTSRTEDALDPLRRAVALNPTRLAPRNLLLRADLATGNLDEARTLATATLLLDPTNPDALSFLHNSTPAPATQDPAATWTNLSLTLYQQHDYPGCAAAARHAIALDPNLPEAWNNLAAADLGLAQWDDAILAANRALTLRPDFPLARNNLAWAQSHRPNP